MVRRRFLAFAIAMILGAACTDDGPERVGAGNCTPTPITTAPIGLPEVAAAATGGTVYGLLFTQPPVRVGSEVKIVWRVTGRGGLAVIPTDPAGGVHALAWGPEAHGDSNWDRPGEEWGTAVVFDRPGCWRLRAERQDVGGDVWLEVVA
jgi:hypothetical protein